MVYTYLVYTCTRTVSGTACGKECRYGRRSPGYTYTIYIRYIRYIWYILNHVLFIICAFIYIHYIREAPGWVNP